MDVTHLVELGGKAKSYFNRNVYVNLADKHCTDRLNNFTDSCSNTDVYYGIYTYCIKDILHQDKSVLETCKLLAPFYLDFDIEHIEIEDNYKTVRRELYQTVMYFYRDWGIPKEYIEIYFSGAKGFHLLIRPVIFDGKPEYDLNRRYKALAKFVAKKRALQHVDLQIYDRKRLFRIPNSINSKSGLYKIPLSLHTLMYSTYEEIKELARTPQEPSDIPIRKVQKAAKYYKYLFTKVKKKQARKTSSSFSAKKVEQDRQLRQLLPCIKEVLEFGTEQGKRNSTTIALASSLFQAGYSLEDTRNILIAWNNANSPPLSQRELETTMMSAYRMSKDERFYGCSSIQDLGLCTAGCSLLKR